MAEMRTWTENEARAAVEKAIRDARFSGLAFATADAVLAALGIDGDVTVVPGRLEQVGVGAQGVAVSVVSTSVPLIMCNGVAVDSSALLNDGRVSIPLPLCRVAHPEPGQP